MPAITLDTLSSFEGVETRGISIVNHQSLYFGEEQSNTWKIFDVYKNFKNPLKLVIEVFKAEYYLCKGIAWADFIIWQWDTRIYLPHFWFLKFSNKPKLIEWLGSDIRIPEVVMSFNPYYKREVENGTYSYNFESKSRSNRIQRKFKYINAIPFLCPEMTLFLNKDIFPKYYTTFQRINLSNYIPKYPSPLMKKVTIVHTPSATGAKGTKYVRLVISKLKLDFDIEYIEVHNKSHKEAIDAISKADLYLDQFIAGSYGMATCEALALGKPVLCYLMQPVVEILPEDLPILNTNIDTLETNIKYFLLNPEKRNEVGIMSRKYAEKYHDSKVLTYGLFKLIQNLILLR